MSGDDNAPKPPPQPTVEDAPAGDDEVTRRESQTASEWVDSQLQLEADAREALPYSFDNCTRPLGALRQNVFACLTCHPPPSNTTDHFTPAGLCYGCSIACHGEHTLVEIFARRNFTCDCGTTRFPDAAPCTLRANAATGRKGGVHGEEPAEGNVYNHNFQNRFCGCAEWYVAPEQKGTMYQCLGLASEADGGCGEDWWHPECLLGLPRDWYTRVERPAAEGDDDEHPVPPGFPDEDAFETLICYKCVQATPWLKAYAGRPGFMALPYQDATTAAALPAEAAPAAAASSTAPPPTVGAAASATESSAPKRKLDDDEASTSSKRARTADAPAAATPPGASAPPAKHADLAAPSTHALSLLTSPDFRTDLCRCPTCYPRLARHPYLLEPEETYQPPLSSSSSSHAGGSTAGGSLLDRGEAALNAVDRVRAIEGVMAYNHLRDKVKAFLQPFAASGTAVGAEDVERYFAKLRGDEAAIREAGRGAERRPEGDGDGEGPGGPEAGPGTEQRGY